MRTTNTPKDAGMHAASLCRLLERVVDEVDRYIGCGPGWYPLLAELEARLGAVEPTCQLASISERDGRLEVVPATGYATTGPARAVLAAAQQRAARTCEFTGSAGVLMERGGRLRTLDPTSAPAGYRVVVPGDSVGENRHLFEVLSALRDQRQCD